MDDKDERGGIEMAEWGAELEQVKTSLDIPLKKRELMMIVIMIVMTPRSSILGKPIVRI